MGEPMNDREKARDLKKCIGKLRGDLTKIGEHTHRIDQRLADVSGKVRGQRVELSTNLSELQALDNQLLLYRAKVKGMKEDAASKSNHTALESFEDLCQAADDCGGTGGDPVQRSLAIACAAIQRLQEATDQERDAHAAHSSHTHGEAPVDEPAVSASGEGMIKVHFTGAKARQVTFGINKTTRFADVLRQTCEYWSLPKLGVLLLDANLDAYPNNDVIFHCPDGIPTDVYLKQCQLDQNSDGLDTGAVVGSAHGSDDLDGSASGNKKGGLPVRNHVDLIKYCELLIYFLALALYTISMIERTNGAEFYPLNAAVQQSLYDQPFLSDVTNENIVFSGITSEMEFWQWVEGPLKSAITTNGSNEPIDCKEPTDLKIDTAEYGKDWGTICYSGRVYSPVEQSTSLRRLEVSASTPMSRERMQDRDYTGQEERFYECEEDVQVVNTDDPDAEIMEATSSNGELCAQHVRCANWFDQALFLSTSKYACLGDSVSFSNKSEGLCEGDRAIEDSTGYYYGNMSCLLVPAAALSLNGSYYDSMPCNIVGAVCEQRIGFYTLRRFNHMHGTAVVQQYRVNDAPVASCASNSAPAFVGDIVDGTQYDCAAPFSADPMTPGSLGQFQSSEYYLALTGQATATNSSDADVAAAGLPIPDMFRCIESARNVLNFVSGMRLIDGPYYPSCSFDAKLPPVPSNFYAALSRIKGKGWVDKHTRALVVSMNFYNPSLEVVIVTRATCEFTAGGSVICVSELSAIPVVLEISNDPTFLVNFFVLMLLCVQGSMTCARTYQMGFAYFGCGSFKKPHVPHHGASGPDYKQVSRYARGPSDGEEDGRLGSEGTKLNTLGVLTLFFIVLSLAIDIQYALVSKKFFESYNDGDVYSGLQFSNKINNLYDFVDMQALADLYGFAVNLRAFAVFFQFLQIFKYMTLHPQMMLLFNAVDMATTELINVIMVIVILMFAVLIPLWYLYATVTGDLLYRTMDAIYINFEVGLSPDKYPQAVFFEEQIMVICFTGMYFVVLVIVYGAIVASILSEAYIYLLNRVCEDGYFWYAVDSEADL